ncbi:hypothetical protein EVA25_02980 [bacterium]|nr:MAG: hypothetical protein EVA25_02980 [bacterium]
MKNKQYRKRWRRWTLLVVGIVLVTARVATWPVETQQGVNFVVSTHTMPLYLKVFEFIDRSAHYERIISSVTDGLSSDEAIVETLFDWTRINIRDTPEGWTITDDHILNIIIRGHGMSDQQADVLTTLVTYSGVPAFWMALPQDAEQQVLLSFVLVDGTWRVCDVANGFLFRAENGELASLEQLQARSSLVGRLAERTVIDGVPYTDVLQQVRMPTPPNPLRAELQMPLKRLVHEIRSGFNFGMNDGSEQ